MQMNRNNHDSFFDQQTTGDPVKSPVEDIKWRPKAIVIGDEFWKFTFFSGTIVALHEANFTEFHIQRDDFPEQSPSVVRKNGGADGYRPGSRIIGTMIGKTTTPMAWMGIIDSYDSNELRFWPPNLLEHFFLNENQYWRSKKRLAGRFLFRVYFNMYYAHARSWWPNDTAENVINGAKLSTTELVRDACDFTRFWRVPTSWCVPEVESERRV